MERYGKIYNISAGYENRWKRLHGANKYLFNLHGTKTERGWGRVENSGRAPNPPLTVNGVTHEFHGLDHSSRSSLEIKFTLAAQLHER